MFMSLKVETKVYEDSCQLLRLMDPKTYEKDGDQASTSYSEKAIIHIGKKISQLKAR